MPCSGPLHCSHIADYVYDFVLSLMIQMLVLLSLCEMLSMLLSILVYAASLFCTCLVSVQVSALCIIPRSMQELYIDLSLRTDGMVAFEDIPVFGDDTNYPECFSICNRYSQDCSSHHGFGLIFPSRFTVHLKVPVGYGTARFTGSHNTVQSAINRRAHCYFGTSSLPGQVCSSSRNDLLM